MATQLNQFTEIARLKIDGYEDRRSLVSILTDNGYTVEINKKYDPILQSKLLSCEIVIYERNLTLINEIIDNK